MKIAATIFRNEISPLFDAAGTLWIFDFDAHRPVTLPANMQDIDISIFSSEERRDVLHKNAVELLLCGAISREAQDLLQDAGIEIRAWLSGPLQNILQHLPLEAGSAQRAPKTTQSSQEKTLGIFCNSSDLNGFLQTCRDASFILKVDRKGQLLGHTALQDQLAATFANRQNMAHTRGRGRQRMQHAQRGPMQGQSQRIIEAMRGLQLRDLLSQHCGPNALGLLHSAGLKVFISRRQQVSAALSDHFQGKTEILDFKHFNNANSRTRSSLGHACGRGRRRR